MIAACGDNTVSVDAGPQDTPAPPETPGLGPIIELGLLPARTPTAVFAHSFEPSIAAVGDTVIVAYINVADADPATYAEDGDRDKRVAVAVSKDRGTTFSAPRDPMATTHLNSTDPVIRHSPGNRFWIATLGVNGSDPDSEVGVGASIDGVTWQQVARIPALDKEWFAIDQTSIWLAYTPRLLDTGLTRMDFAGNVLAQTASAIGTGATGGYADATGFHVAYLPEVVNSECSLPCTVPFVFWDGTDAPVVEGERLPVGLEVGDSYFPYTTTSSLGPTPDGGQWIVRTVKRDGLATIVLRIRRLPGDEGSDIVVSGAAEQAFLPTAIIDDDGRLRVIYYDSAGVEGVLRTTRSRAADWSLGFEPATVVERNVCPGDRWLPSFNTDGRRLREYIDVTKTNRRIHFAWTRSPEAPSRARASYIDY